MDSNHRFPGVGRKSSPLDHGTGRVEGRETRVENQRTGSRLLPALVSQLSALRSRPSLDSPGVAPGLPVCRTGVLLLDHEPVRCASRCSSSVVSGSRGTRTHKRLSAATCFRDRLLILPDDFRDRELRGQDSNLRTRDSKSRISTDRNYPASPSALRELNPPVQLGRLVPLPIGQGHVQAEGEGVEPSRLIARPLSGRLPSPVGLPFRKAAVAGIEPAA